MDDPSVDELVPRIKRALASRGVSFGTDGGTAAFRVDDHDLMRELVVLPPATPARELRRSRERHQSVVFLSDRITPAVAREIRASGGWYADAGGNAFLRAPGVIVDVRGASSTGENQSTPRSTPPRNLMSAARAQVVFAVLTWPQLLTQSLREIALAAGVSPAAAHTALRLLEEERYLTRSRLLTRRDDLIDLWASSYPLGLARSIERGRFRGEPDPTAWQRLGHHVYVSGEFAAAEITGPDLVLYVPELDPRALIASRWRRPDAEGEANIVVRRTFWNEPDGPAQAPGIEAAPDLLVYGDLLASDDPRQREIASGMRADL